MQGRFRRADRLIEEALEAAEEEILAGMDTPEAAETAATALARFVGNAETAQALLARIEVARGDRLIRAGATSADVYLIESGRLTVQVDGPAGQPVRLRSMRPGALVGEVASYAGVPRTADVIAETDAVVYRARPGVPDLAAREAHDLAAAWHRMIAMALAEKLHRTNTILGER